MDRQRPKNVSGLPSKTALLLKACPDVAHAFQFSAKSTAGHYKACLLRCVLAVSFKRLGHAALGVRRVVYHLIQRQIAQLGTAVKVAPRINVAAHHHDIRGRRD